MVVASLTVTVNAAAEVAGKLTVPVNVRLLPALVVPTDAAAGKGDAHR